MILQEYTRRAAVSHNESFIDGPANVTVLAYFFREAERYDEKFIFLRGALLETWRKCGRMKTVLVSNAKGDSLSEFANAFPWVEVQVEPALVPGDLSSMSIDCDSRLYNRFSTEYVLTIQDDGFPLRGGLDEFLGMYDYIGAPFVRHATWFDWYPYPRFCVGNGGFSLRSKRICEVAASYYNRYFKRLPYFWPLVGDDTFYCKTLRMLFPKYRRQFEFAPPEVAGMFSVEGNWQYFPVSGVPLGFHGRNAWRSIRNRMG